MTATGLPFGTRSSSALKRPAVRRRNADQVEVGAGYQGAVKAFGALGPAHRSKAERCRLSDGKAVERGHAVAIVAIVGIGEADVAAVTRLCCDRDEVALACDARQRVEQHRFHPAEDHAVGADSEAERHDHRGSHPRALASIRMA